VNIRERPVAHSSGLFLWARHGCVIFWGKIPQCDNPTLAEQVGRFMVNVMKQLIFLLTLLAAPPTGAHADQTDPRLDAYFDALYQTEDAIELQILESQIWSVWRSAEQPAVDEAFTLGMDAMQSSDYIRAIDQFTQAIELHPEFAEAYNMRATTHFLMGNNFESLTDVQITIDLEPRHFGALMGGAQIAMRSGQTELALEFVEAALALSPNNVMWKTVAERLRDITGTMDL
jgi:tetratricopeptide (TPR) repeat protein